MNASAPTDLPDVPLARVVAGRRRISWAWLAPLAAALLLFLFLWQSYRERGPLLVISLRDARGLEVGSPLRYRGLDAGHVERIQIKPLLDGIEVFLRLTPSAAGLAREGSRFWVVRPQLSLEGAAGLETILGRRFLQVLPGEGPARVHFQGLEEPPVMGELPPGGLQITLEAARRGGLRPGAHVLYRQVLIGRVLSVQLSSDASAVEAVAYIEPAYQALVKPGSCFWNVSGLSLEAGLLKGLRLDFDSVQSLLSGGVAMATPEGISEPVSSGHRFALHDRPEETWLEWRPSLAVGQDLVPQGSDLPQPRSARLGFKEGRVFPSEREVAGFVLVLDGGVIGPRDLLRGPEGARLRLGEESFVLPAPLPGEPTDLVELPLSAAAPYWPRDRTRRPREREDVVLVGPSQLPLSTARLGPGEAAWEVDASVPLDPSWHGATVVSRANGDVIGMLSVTPGTARVLLWPASR